MGGDSSWDGGVVHTILCHFDFFTFTSGLISRFFVLYYSYLSSNVSYARPIPLGAFVTCL